MGRASQYESPQELTPREREVRELLRLGLTDVEIAERLSISKSGVGHHVSAIMAKLRVANRYEAAYWPERPPWFAHGVMLAGIFWRRSGPIVTGSKASSAALALSGGAFLAALGTLALVAALLIRTGGVEPSIAPASAFVEPTIANEPLGFAPSAEPPALATPSPNKPEAPLATPTPASQPVPAVLVANVGELPALEVTSTPLPPAQPTSTRTPGPKSTPGPPQPGVMVVDCDAAEAGVQTACQYEEDALFRLQVHIIRPPEFGYAFFGIKLEWDASGIAYMPAPDPIEEALWPRCNEEEEQKRWLITLEALAFKCIPDPFPDSALMDIGAVLEFQFRCHQNGIAPIVLAVVPLDGPNRHDATHFMDGPLEPLGTDTNGARVTCGP